MFVAVIGFYGMQKYVTAGREQNVCCVSCLFLLCLLFSRYRQLNAAGEEVVRTVEGELEKAIIKCVNIMSYV